MLLLIWANTIVYGISIRFQKYTDGGKKNLKITVHNSEVVKVTRETEQCKTCFSSYKLKTEMQKKLKLCLKWFTF